MSINSNKIFDYITSFVVEQLAKNMHKLFALGCLSQPTLTVLRVCPREDQAGVTHAISPISFKLSQMIKVIKLFKSPK